MDLATFSQQKIADNFYCESCDYKCSKNSEWFSNKNARKIVIL